MALTLSGLSAIAGRKGNQFIEAQVNQAAPLLQVLKKEQCKGELYKLNIQAGGLASVAIIAGSGTYPTASNSGITQAPVLPVPMVGLVTIPVDSATVIRDKADAVSLVKNQFDRVSENLGRTLGTACIDGYLANVEGSASISGGVVTASVHDVSRFRYGAAVDWSDAGTVNANPFTVTSITDDGDGSGSVVFSTSATGALAVGDGFYLRGFKGMNFASLADIAGSADLYNTTVSNSDWAGVSISAGGALSFALMRRLASDIQHKSGMLPDVWVMSPRMFAEYEDLSVGSASGSLVRVQAGDKLDPYGNSAARPTFMGGQIVVDPNCPNKKIFAFRKDKVALAEFAKFSPLQNKSTGLAEVNQSTYDYTIRLHGLHNMIVHQRNAVGELTSLTIS